jgi:hypothetical protein
LSEERGNPIVADDRRLAERPIVAVVCSAGTSGVASRTAKDSGTRRSVQSTPDTHGTNSGGDVIPLSSARDPNSTGDCDFQLLRDVAEAAAHANDAISAAQAILDIVTEGLGLSSGTLALLDVTPEGVRRLVPTASSGPQSPLVREMPPIEVDSGYEAAVVFRESRPHYVGDVHGEGSAAEPGARSEEEGAAVSRWRSLISTKSYAVLPLCAGPRPIGVLTLQWPDSRSFDPHATELLRTIASIAAVTLDRPMSRFQTGQPRSATTRTDEEAGGPAGEGSHEQRRQARPGPAGSPHTPVGPLRLEVTTDGVLMPLSPDASSGPDSSLALEVTLADAACVVWDISAPHPGIVAILIASFADADTADAMRDRLVQTKRVCARQDMPLHQTHSLLNGVVLASASPGVAVPVWLAWIDAGTGAVTHCGTADADVVAHAADGRTWTPKLSAAPLGTSGGASCGEDVRLLLPGDRIMMRLGEADLRITRP